VYIAKQKSCLSIHNNEDQTMKHGNIISIAIALLLSNQLVLAGSVTDAFESGDKLTAAKMQNIKTAVNDNNNASRFYGDGSAGELTIASTVSWLSEPPAGNNLNFTNVVIDADATLVVPAGTVIRCSGSLINNGVISAAPAHPNNGPLYSIDSKAFSRAEAPSKGDTQKAASSPEGHTALGVFLAGGRGGIGIPQTVAASSFDNFKIGGGASSGSQGRRGGSGGGLIKIYCAGGITNNGEIRADGGAFTGSGGGIVVLASSTSISNDLGTIQARGRSGTTGDQSTPAGGGGGGGIVILAAPDITNTGTTIVSGGNAGATLIALTFEKHSAGSGGGASGGNGGNGATLSSSNTVITSPTAGEDGYVLEIKTNPAHMM
jgi:hypothetical protein